MSESPLDVRRPIDALLEQRAFLRRLARSLVRDESAADDLEQDTWVAALKQPPTAPHAAFSWLASTARRIAGKVRRGADRRTRREQAVAPVEPVDSEETTIQRLELQRVLLDALWNLDEPYRTVVTMRYLDECSPRTIADRLGVPLNTVRARLRRGLERLRVRLDAAADGDRRAWCVALAPFADLSLASTGIVTGVVAMGTKSMVAGAVVAASAFVSVVLWTLPPDDPTKSAALDASRPEVESRGLDPASHAVAAEAVAVTRQEAVADPLDPAAGLAPPGTLGFRVVDANTGFAIVNAGVRLLNVDRYAQWQGDGEGTLDVTAGSYELTAFAPGYETLTRAGVVVDPRAKADLGTLALEPGTGSIQGTAWVAGVASSGPITIELFGRGRRWCSDCDRGVVRVPVSAVVRTSADMPVSGETVEEVACDRCGFRDGSSELTIASGQRFEFNGLAAGEYLVRIRCDGTSSYPFVRSVTLARGRTAWIDAPLEVGVDVEFALVGPDGEPFEGTWKAADEVRARRIFFTFDGETDHEFEATWQPPSRAWGTRGTRVADSAEIGTVAFDSGQAARITSGRGEQLGRIPILAALTFNSTQLNLAVRSAGELGEITLDRGDGASDRADRPRAADDRAVPPDLEDRPSAPPLVVDHVGPGRLTVRDVPPRFLDVVVHCGPFGSDRFALDTRAGDPGPIRVALRRIVCDGADAATPSPFDIRALADAQSVVTINLGIGTRPAWDLRTTTCTSCHERR